MQLDIDFEDSRGFVELEPVMQVRYASVGKKQLTVRATTGEGLHLFARVAFSSSAFGCAAAVGNMAFDSLSQHWRPGSHG